MARPHHTNRRRLETLIRATLQASVADAEPAPQIWERIEHNVQSTTPAHNCNGVQRPPVFALSPRTLRGLSTLA